MVLWIDSREPAILKALTETALGPENTWETRLDTGDYLIFDRDACTFAIERKSVSDLLGSLSSGRLEAQTQRLVDTYTYPILLVEGHYTLTKQGFVQVGYRETKWRHGAMHLALWSLQERTGVRVLWADDKVATADLLRSIHARGERQCFGKHRERARPKKPRAA